MTASNTLLSCQLRTAGKRQYPLIFSQTSKATPPALLRLEKAKGMKNHRIWGPKSTIKRKTDPRRSGGRNIRKRSKNPTKNPRKPTRIRKSFVLCFRASSDAPIKMGIVVFSVDINLFSIF
ncbi:hypothetical protein H5410_039000 [Solanum commersonii]|uniref:Uncharacterized protein n=1 Tax=Solanum commersonii TaxID=4109 RepID=A0A9J5YDV3_SOLCO|nr:hypothetical protein H5410_039000 [Solanum commersonii]